MKALFFYLSIFLVLLSCKNHQDYKKESAEPEIREKVNKLYTLYSRSNETLYDRPLQKDLFSSDLEDVIKKAISVSKADIEKVKSSAHPTDKPLILEGEVFSSLYEGYTTYKIKSVDIIANRANVSVDFEYDKVSPQIIWTDTIHLINTDDKHWKIDNIIFNNSISTATDLKNSLEGFISYAEENLEQ
ncbi:hypothetical protein [Chryseobacterium sp. ISL-6]|uniref:hypothetical protein n=1 Tax=Chryseobacterium sp. ISL-6 TaxID=2819143 RepID=UPI001BEA2C62|nr:hypothetical protein [Chryseobacterium sp. ISL-6]MBT2619282.1 hypothetical protein [Chryseobacterium sp. ISL-6]